MANMSIVPLLERHAEEAAFYWQQRDQSLASAHLKPSNLRNIDLLLQAYLDGLASADEAGWQLAWEAQERWQGAGEVFVCAVLAAQPNVHVERLQQLVAHVAQAPAYRLRGLISALLWCGPERIAPLIDAWTQADASLVQQTVAWRVLARSPGYASANVTTADLAARLHAALQHPEAHLRAAACRACAGFGQTAALAHYLADPHPAVAAEAAIALAASDPQRSVLPLWQSVWQHIQSLPTSGRARAQAEHRAQRWLQHLALCVPLGNPDVPRLLDALPPRLGLHFVLHHADPAHLPWVVGLMDDTRCARRAGWVWQAISGIDLAQHALTRPQATDTTDETTTDTATTDELDPGLPWPDAQKIAVHPLSLPTAPVLLGQTLTQPYLRSLLVDAPQPLRWNAAQRLASVTGKPSFNIRARVHAQRTELAPITETTP